MATKKEQTKIEKTAKKEKRLSLSQGDIKALKYVAAEITKQQTVKANQPDNATEEKKPKMWNELTVEERVERMRAEMKKTMLRTQRQLSAMERQMHYMKTHVHDKDGKAIVQQLLTNYYGHGEDSMLDNTMGQMRPDSETYF